MLGQMKGEGIGGKFQEGAHGNCKLGCEKYGVCIFQIINNSHVRAKKNNLM